MRFILTAAGKDLRRRLADPAALAIWIGIPLVLGALMSIVLGDGDAPRARVLVADLDQTVSSRLLVAAAGNGGETIPFDIEAVALDDGRRRMDDGEASALLVLPAGFQESILRDRPAAIEVVTNPAERILPGMIEETLEILVEAVFYGQRLFGPVLGRLADGAAAGPPSNADVAALSVEINERLSRLQDLVIPPVISLEVRLERPDDGPRLDFGQLFLPGIVFMSFLFIAQGMSVDIWQEKTRGTLRRTLATPQPAYRLLAGKIAAGGTLMAVIGLAALAAAVPAFGISWARVPLALAWCVFAGTALIAYMTLLQTLASGQRGGEMLSTVVVMPLMMIGGSFFPFDVMPAWMVAIGQWTPNGLAVLRLKDVLYGTPAPTALAVAAAGIGLPAAAAFAVTVRRLQGRFWAA